MSSTQLEIIINHVKSLPPDDLVRLIKQVAEMLEEKQSESPKPVASEPAQQATSSVAVDLRSLGIDEAQAAELRASFATFEDWNDPEMDIYNDYDAAKSALDHQV